MECTLVSVCNFSVLYILLVGFRDAIKVLHIVEQLCKLMLIKYLGALIDENLFWKHHILHIASKRTTSIGIIARLRPFVPLNTLQHIYRSLIQPYLLYGITVWVRADKTQRN